MKNLFKMPLIDIENKLVASQSLLLLTDSPLLGTLIIFLLLKMVFWWKREIMKNSLIHIPKELMHLLSPNKLLLKLSNQQMRVMPMRMKLNLEKDNQLKKTRSSKDLYQERELVHLLILKKQQKQKNATKLMKKRKQNLRSIWKRKIKQDFIAD